MRRGRRREERGWGVRGREDKKRLFCVTVLLLFTTISVSFS